ncbi:hypothetical protein AX17_004255 [Amanita inopinata Kibby_2008]|nr:hypothetical protein AX17_004255 [Amanita inopinata Kibby_2008]
MATASQKPFYLYTAATPNGHCVTMLLEEMKSLYSEVDYDYEPIEIWKTRHKEPWFLAMNPNGRIPVLLDKNQDNFPVFETSAIMLYLTDHYDKDRKFSFDPVKEPKEYSETLQWLFFTHGGIGPMQGQSHHFHRYAPEMIEYAKKRYLEETKRLYGVLELRLKDRDWLAGAGRGKYTIADMKAFPWLRIHKWAMVESLDEWPNVKAWVARIAERVGSERGLAVGDVKKADDA